MRRHICASLTKIQKDERAVLSYRLRDRDSTFVGDTVVTYYIREGSLDTETERGQSAIRLQRVGDRLGPRVGDLVACYRGG